jgi:serine/threonine protein kinase
MLMIWHFITVQKFPNNLAPFLEPYSKRQSVASKMSTSSQEESPRRREELLTSDTFLLTPFSTQIGAEEQQPRLPPQIAALGEDFFKTRRPHQISSIDSLLSFVNYYSAIPVGNIPNLYVEENVSGFLYEPDVSILGMGMSFMVQAERSYPIPEYILERVPSWQKRATKPSCVAVKVPRIDRRESLHPDENVEKRCLRAIAWECHVLSHPSIRACKNVISMFGLTWRPAFAGKGGKRRLLPSLVLEFASEGSLSNFFKSSTFCLTYATKLGVVLDIARGLEVLHRHGIIHGDVKAENVLLTFDSDGMLIAKLSDFACSIHDFGDAGQQWMPGRSPPWDAPEVRHGAVARSKAHKTDIYSFGLLTWRTMLECRTPFDNTPGLKEYSAFEDISQAIGQIEKMFLVQNLKEKEDDELLTRIKTSLPGHGLNESQVFEFLNCTVRFHPKDRLDSIGEIFEKSGSSREPTQVSKFASNQLSIPNSKLSNIVSLMNAHSNVVDSRADEGNIDARC